MVGAVVAEVAAAVVVAEVEIVIIVIVAMTEVEEIVAKVEVLSAIVAQGVHHHEDHHPVIKNLEVVGILVQNQINHQDGEMHHQRKNQLVKDGAMPRQIKMTHQNQKPEVDGDQVPNLQKDQVVGVKNLNQNPMINPKKYQNPNRYRNQPEWNRSQYRSSLLSLIKSLMNQSQNQSQFRLQFHQQHITTKTLP